MSTSQIEEGIGTMLLLLLLLWEEGGAAGGRGGGRGGCGFSFAGEEADAVIFFFFFRFFRQGHSMVRPVSSPLVFFPSMRGARHQVRRHKR